MGRIGLIITGLCAVMFTTSCGRRTEGNFGIIPQAASVQEREGFFRLTENTPVWAQLAGHETALLQNAGIPGRWTEDEPGPGGIKLKTSEGLSADSYRLEITAQGVDISAGAVSGLFYGLQTFRQLCELNGRQIPCGVIEDGPRMGYRALMLDVSHHFFTADFIRRQIDMMACLKMNRLVLMLASDGGWRFGAEGYPQLAGFGAWRPVEQYAGWVASGRGFCAEGTPGAYGGYYTRQDLEEIATYARERFIEVIPALDIPCAHVNTAALFEGLECGVGIDPRFELEVMEDIVGQLLDIFPSGFVYLGDGRASVPQSVSCMECRPKVEKGKTGNIDDNRHGRLLASIGDFLAGRGVRLMAWEESIRGVLPQDAALVAWHDPQEAVTAAGMGYDVVVAPSAYSSLDFYQTDPTSEPLSTMGFLPLERVYNFDPLPRGTAEEVASRIVGVQGNLWTYNIVDRASAERKLYPRLMAIAEAGWSMPGRKSYPDFRRRVNAFLPVLERSGYGYFDPAGEVTVRPESTGPLTHKAVGKTVTYRTRFNTTYPGMGEGTLTDGRRGGWSLEDGSWQGFTVNDIDVVIDLGSVTALTSVEAEFMRHPVAGIWFPSRVEVYLSADGEDFRLAGVDEGRLPARTDMFTTATFGWTGKETARFVRFVARQGGGTGGWLFTDEIVVR